MDSQVFKAEQLSASPGEQSGAQLHRRIALTMLLSTRVLMTVPKRRTNFSTSEDPLGVSGTFPITNRLFQATGARLCNMQQHLMTCKLAPDMVVASFPSTVFLSLDFI